jgi:hypothetical protein
MTLIREKKKDASRLLGEVQADLHNTHKTETKKHLVANRHDRRRFAAAAKSFHKKFGIPSPLSFEQYIELRSNKAV